MTCHLRRKVTLVHIDWVCHEGVAHRLLSLCAHSGEGVLSLHLLLHHGCLELLLHHGLLLLLHHSCHHGLLLLAHWIGDEGRLLGLLLYSRGLNRRFATERIELCSRGLCLGWLCLLLIWLAGDCVKLEDVDVGGSVLLGTRPCARQ